MPNSQLDSVFSGQVERFLPEGKMPHALLAGAVAALLSLAVLCALDSCCSLWCPMLEHLTALHVLYRDFERPSQSGKLC